MVDEAKESSLRHFVVKSELIFYNPHPTNATTGPAGHLITRLSQFQFNLPVGCFAKGDAVDRDEVGDRERRR